MPTVFALQFTFDTNDVVASEAFWCAALEYTVLPSLMDPSWSPTDPGERPEDRRFQTWLTDPGQRRPTLYFQWVPETKVGKNRTHLDLVVGRDAMESEAARMEGLGATRVQTWGDPPHCIVMCDPQGNEFCLIG